MVTHSIMSKTILFVTGTRADFGKLKPLMLHCKQLTGFQVEVFVTGMHLLSRYGSTWEEIAKSNIGPIHPFLNQSSSDSMDIVLAKTISGLSDYVKEKKPDLLVIHGDRVETLAAAIVGSLNNIRVAHIEGGEVSGTIDESIRHAVSKLAHIHLVSNEQSFDRLVQLGENREYIFTVGSPDIDVMESDALPKLDEAKGHYGIDFTDFGIMILHPVTTEQNKLEEETRNVLSALKDSGKQIIIVESNNDSGSELIRNSYNSFRDYANFKFFPSMRFEFFITLLKYSDFIIGNSSAGVREAPHFGVPAINLGSRQNGRVKSNLVLNSSYNIDEISEAISQIETIDRVPEQNFGKGNSSQLFGDLLTSGIFWNVPLQKVFIDIDWEKANGSAK